MKKTGRILMMALAVLMMAGLLSGCGMQAKLDALVGTYTRIADDTEEQALLILENMDFYEEEIACVDLTSLDYIHVVEFTADKTYRFACDTEGTKACVEAFFRSAYEAMYENRASLNEVYGQDFSAMTMEDFGAFYAALYGYETYDALVAAFAENAYDYEALAGDFETGTFTISGNQILCTITGESEAEAMGYELNGNVLTLTFADSVQTFTKAA